jgi:hypothetical protein
MSVLRPLLSRRGRLVFVASALLLMAALVAAPSVSNAASIKQFTAAILPDTAVGGIPGTWTEQVKNCGTPVLAPCTAASTIAIGQVRITVPAEFRSDPFSVSASASNGNNWTASYNSGTGVIVAQAVTGNDKLSSGEIVDIAIGSIPECISGPKQFTTTAVGGLPNGPNNQTFSIVGSQPSVTIAGCQLASGGSATDPATGQTDTVTGSFGGHVNLTFGGDAPDCSGDAEFGAFGDQWQVYHQATPSTITPADDFVVGGPKVWTSEFPLSTAPGGPDADSSWYLTCYAVPQAGHARFETRGDGLAVEQTVGGVLSWVGILASCADAPIPCVSEQFLTTGPGGPPWSPSNNMVHIAITIDPGDPHRT